MRTPKYVVSMLCLIPAALYAQTPPDFSGVYYPINPFGANASPGRRPLRKRRGYRKTIGSAAATHPVGAARRWLSGAHAQRALAHARVHGEVGSDPEIAHGRILGVR